MAKTAQYRACSRSWACPVVGCGVLASALCMDKARAHKLVQAEGIRVPRSFSHQRPYCVREIVQEADGLGIPCL